MATKKPGRREPEYKLKLPALRDWLIRVAQSQGKVRYGEVMKVFGMGRFNLSRAMGALGRQAQSNGEPIITALIVNAKGRCSEGLAKEFHVTDDEAERERLYKYWASAKVGATAPESPEDSLEVRAAKFASVKVRPEQAAFRRLVFLACKGRCVISGCDVVRALDAAHRHGRDWRKGHNKGSDGYLLRKDLHALYDGDLLKINAKGAVELTASAAKHYGVLSGTKVLGTE